MSGKEHGKVRNVILNMETLSSGKRGEWDFENKKLINQKYQCQKLDVEIK